jgi:hypothetical protein
MKLVVKPLLQLADEKNLAMALVHHARKGIPQAQNLRLTDESLQGSNILLRQAGAVWSIEKLKQDAGAIHTISLKKSWFTETHDDIAGFVIEPGFYGGLILRYSKDPRIDAPNSGGRPSKSEAVEATIADFEGEFTTKDLYEKLPAVGQSTVRDVISGLVNSGRLQRRGHGKDTIYSLVA